MKEFKYLPILEKNNYLKESEETLMVLENRFSELEEELIQLEVKNPSDLLIGMMEGHIDKIKDISFFKKRMLKYLELHEKSLLGDLKLDNGNNVRVLSEILLNKDVSFLKERGQEYMTQLNDDIFNLISSKFTDVNKNKGLISYLSKMKLQDKKKIVKRIMDKDGKIINQQLSFFIKENNPEIYDLLVCKKEEIEKEKFLSSYQYESHYSRS